MYVYNAVRVCVLVSGRMRIFSDTVHSALHRVSVVLFDPFFLCSEYSSEWYIAFF